MILAYFYYMMFWVVVYIVVVVVEVNKNLNRFISPINPLLLPPHYHLMQFESYRFRMFAPRT